MMTAKVAAMLAYFVDNFDPFIFRLWDNVGPRWYGFAYVLAFISAYFVVRLLSKRGYCDLPPERVSDFITWTALFGVLLSGQIWGMHSWSLRRLVCFSGAARTSLTANSTDAPRTFRGQCNSPKS